jgi:hypothetical protein
MLKIEFLEYGRSFHNKNGILYVNSRLLKISKYENDNQER